MAATNLLVRLLGFRALLIHGDPLVLDRWLWLRRRLRRYAPRGGELVDAGSGNGAFTIGAARIGYRATGLTWDVNDRARSEERAALVGAARARFEVQDLRALHERRDLSGSADIVVSFENIEHLLDDDKLVTDLAGLLKPGGLLFLTTPNVAYRPIDRSDDGPWLPIEDGRHVRKGYDEARLRELAAGAGLDVVEISACSGFTSQKIEALHRRVRKLHPVVGWLAVLPLRWLPVALDPALRRLTRWPDYSIGMVARRPAGAAVAALDHGEELSA